MKLTLKEISQVAHEVNKACCEAYNDYSQLPYDQCPDWQKNSSLEGVQNLIDNPLITPEQLHNKWKEYKTSNGWVFGEIKDEKLKTHPCLIPYAQLPKKDKIKDFTFQAVVKTLLNI